MMRNLSLLFIYIACTLFISCAEEILSENIESSKILRYYEAHCINNETCYITAHFYKDGGLTILPFREAYGKPVTLTGSSKVYCNGQEMAINQDLFKDISYRLKLDTWPESFIFEWYDNNGKKYTDGAKMETIALGDKKLIKEGNQKAVIWKGAPIQKNEEVTIHVENGTDESLSYSTEVGANYVIIAGSENFQFGGGFYPTKITRKLMQRNVTEISTENVSGSVIQLSFSHDLD